MHLTKEERKHRALQKYKKVDDPAYAQYKKIIDPAWKEYKEECQRIDEEKEDDK